MNWNEWYQRIASINEHSIIKVKQEVVFYVLEIYFNFCVKMEKVKDCEIKDYDLIPLKIE